MQILIMTFFLTVLKKRMGVEHILNTCIKHLHKENYTHAISRRRRTELQLTCPSLRGGTPAHATDSSLAQRGTQHYLKAFPSLIR